MRPPCLSCQVMIGWDTALDPPAPLCAGVRAAVTMLID
jgi:hypothetical protein